MKLWKFLEMKQIKILQELMIILIFIYLKTLNR